MSISIHYPTRGANVGRNFAAFGLTTLDDNQAPISGVIGKLIDTNGGKDVYGRTVLFLDRKGAGGANQSWVILFSASVSGTYTLEVKGVYADGTPTEPARESVGVIAGRPFISVSHPANNSVLTNDEKQYFVAMGDTDTIAESATLGAVSADYIDTSGGVWWATFPVLTMPGTFVFTVNATNTNIGTAINVTVPV